MQFNIYFGVTGDEQTIALIEVGAFIIAQHGDGEGPRGYSFSQETIKLLTEFGASLELDAVKVFESS